MVFVLGLVHNLTLNLCFIVVCLRQHRMGDSGVFKGHFNFRLEWKNKDLIELLNMLLQDLNIKQWKIELLTSTNVNIQVEIEIRVVGTSTQNSVGCNDLNLKY